MLISFANLQKYKMPMPTLSVCPLMGYFQPGKKKET
jgi:hypothetical protein